MLPQSKIKVYVCHRMTGRFQDELVQEAQYTTRYLENHGFEVLDPIITEEIKNVHEPLAQLDEALLRSRWAKDKEQIKDADIVLDYMACNKSDGVAKELGYARFCLWKPVVRVFPNLGLSISRLEDDVIVDNMTDAVSVIQTRFGTYDLLRNWRREMWDRCYFKWLEEQIKMNDRYSLTTTAGATRHLEII